MAMGAELIEARCPAIPGSGLLEGECCGKHSKHGLTLLLDKE